jgi:hypothetical protein
MLNIDETLSNNFDYIIQRDFCFKIILYSFGSIVLIDILRGQVPEINLLQLVPGVYLVLLFGAFIFLLITSDLLFRIPQELDSRKEIGIKTLRKLQMPIFLCINYKLLLIVYFFAICVVVPLSLDSFNSYGENALENLWSFDEVINLSAIFILTLLSMSQFPVLATFYFSTEKAAIKLPNFWKILIFITTVFAGVATPTVDGNAQLNFSFFAAILYVIIINIVERRVNIKYIGLNSLTA